MLLKLSDGTFAYAHGCIQDGEFIESDEITSKPCVAYIKLSENAFIVYEYRGTQHEPTAWKYFYKPKFGKEGRKVGLNRIRLVDGYYITSRYIVPAWLEKRRISINPSTRSKYYAIEKELEDNKALYRIYFANELLDEFVAFKHPYMRLLEILPQAIELDEKKFWLVEPWPQHPPRYIRYGGYLKDGELEFHRAEPDADALYLHESNTHLIIPLKHRPAKTLALPEDTLRIYGEIRLERARGGSLGIRVGNTAIVKGYLKGFLPLHLLHLTDELVIIPVTHDEEKIGYIAGEIFIHMDKDAVTVYRKPRERVFGWKGKLWRMTYDDVVGISLEALELLPEEIGVAELEPLERVELNRLGIEEFVEEVGL